MLDNAKKKSRDYTGFSVVDMYGRDMCDDHVYKSHKGAERAISRRGLENSTLRPEIISVRVRFPNPPH